MTDGSRHDGERRLGASHVVGEDRKLPRARQAGAVGLAELAAAFDGCRLVGQDAVGGSPDDPGTQETQGTQGDLVVGYRCLPSGGSRLEPVETLRMTFTAGGRLHCQAAVERASSSHPLPRSHGGQPPSGDGGQATDKPADLLAGCHLVYEATKGDIVSAVVQRPVDLLAPGRYTVCDCGAGGRWCGPLPPLDMACVPAFADTPVVTGATVQAQMVLTGSPVGLVAYVLTIVDGRPVAYDLGQDSNADVFVQFRYADYLAVRDGTLAVAEALRHGAIDGSFGKAQMLSGLIRSPAFEAAYRQGFSSPRVLARHAAIIDHPSYRLAASDARRALGLDPEDRPS